MHNTSGSKYSGTLLQDITEAVMLAEKCQPKTWTSIELAHREITNRLVRFTGLHDDVLCANCEETLGHHTHRGLYCQGQAGVTPMQLQFWPLICEFVAEDGEQCDAFAALYEFDESQDCDNRALCGNCLKGRFRSRI